MDRRRFLASIAGASSGVVVSRHLAVMERISEWLQRRFRSGLQLRNEITILPADDPRRSRLGWVIYEEIGSVIINDYAVARVNIE